MIRMKSGASATVGEPERLSAQRASGEEAPARARRRDALLWFMANPPREVVEAAHALREAEKQYGDETKRELADLKAIQRRP